MKVVNPKSFGDAIRKKREEKELPLRKVASYLDIDQAILSKIERGKRKATRVQVLKLAEFFQLDEDDLLVNWLSDKIVVDLAGEMNALKVLQVAEEKITYGKSSKAGRDAMIRRLRSAIKDFPAIQRAWLFGSFARQDNTSKSDIDVLIEVPEKETFTLFDIAEVQEKLRQIANRRIDVVMLSAIRPQVKERIQNDLTLIYEA